MTTPQFAASDDPHFPLYPLFLGYLREAAAATEATRGEARATWLEAASRLHSLEVDALGALCVALLERQRAADAVELAACLWRIEPDLPAIAFNCGYVLQMVGHHAESIAPYRRAYELAPDWPSLRNNLAIAIRVSGSDPAEELRLLEQAVEVNPADEQAWINLVVSYRARFDLERSLRAAERALELVPDSALALNNAAFALKEAQRWDDAQRCAERAVEQVPADPTFRFNLAIIQLARGDFAHGLAGHETRWQGSSELRHVRASLPMPRWQGESLAGRTLLVWGEQGAGDLLQFSRVIPLLAERVRGEGGRLVWNSFPQMGALLSRSLGAHVDHYDTTTDWAKLPAADFHLPLASVPWQLGLPDVATGAPAPYLRADAQARAAWRARFEADEAADGAANRAAHEAADDGAAGAGRARGGNRLRVGLSWTGSATHQRNPFRSVGLERYTAAFAGIEGVSFHSLQPGGGVHVAAARAAGLPIVDHTHAWRNFDDTAAYVGALDLVITGCTSVAHLGGAIGQATWVLLDVNPHWVWQLDRRDSPLYPSATLYRQPAFMQWDPVLEAVARDLRALAGGPGAW